MDFYIQASAIITKLDNKAGSIKGLTLHSGEKNGPRTYALILETLKYRDVLRQVIAKSELLLKERKLAAQGNLSLVLVHDLLLNKSGIVANAGQFKDAVIRHKTRLQAEWIKAKIKLKIKDNAAMAKSDTTFIPRWARINTLKITREELMAELARFNVVRTLGELELDCVYVDEHIDNLLAFHPMAQLTSNKFYLDGSLILQNKASCIPAAVLDPPPHASVIDACAAPGNKTSHLAALMNNTGTLFAFERDTRRVSVLRSMMQKSGSNVHVTHGDFTRTDPHDAQYANVTHLLLDPSCSGSGIVNRLDYLTASAGAEAETAENETTMTTTTMTTTGQDLERLESLSSFQLALLLHAMKFPAAREITYSTCSIHALENEGVVMEALRKRPDWRITSRSETLPDWPHRGIPDHCHGDKDVSEGLIRAEPGEMGTIGFFVACFVKRAEQDYQEDDDETREGKIREKRKADDPIFMSDDDEDARSTSTIHASKNTKKNKNKKKRKKKKISTTAT